MSDTRVPVPDANGHFPDDQFVVICRADRRGPRKPGGYVLATRRVFPHYTGAQRYARTVARSRQPIIVAGRWAGLRFGDDHTAALAEPPTTEARRYTEDG